MLFIADTRLLQGSWLRRDKLLEAKSQRHIKPKQNDQDELLVPAEHRTMQALQNITDLALSSPASGF